MLKEEVVLLTGLDCVYSNAGVVETGKDSKVEDGGFGGMVSQEIISNRKFNARAER